MRFLIQLTFILSLLLSQTLLAGDLYRLENCQKETPADEFIYGNDFRWYYTMPEMILRFAEMYNSNKRLKNRAYYDEKTKQFKLPNDDTRGGAVLLPESFVKSVQAHIEEAFKRKVIDGVFFPDMGHSHFFIPRQKYEQRLNDLPTDQMSRFYEQMFADPELLVLYHTAEQLKTLDVDDKVLPDDRLKFRFQTRNLLGYNNGSRDLAFLQNPASKANSAGDAGENYHYWGAGFNLSANKNGCFVYENAGQKYQFDLSLADLARAPGTEEEYDLK